MTKAALEIDDGSGAHPPAADPALALRAEPDGLGADALRSVAQHTPGPWFTDGDEITNAHGAITIAVIPAALDARECVANGRLIAAAPDLLEALVALTAPWNAGKRFADMDADELIRLREQAARAIAKAEGR